ncbi:Protein transport protein SEC1 [Spathaspora sp. JA1]|nr:Protein transport protein SEC1 [Spathaspora sp. JA1]
MSSIAKNKDPTSLLNIQHDYLLAQIKSVQVPGQLYSLIIDNITESILYRVITKEQLLRLVTSIEKVDERRKSAGKFINAIYFVDTNIYNCNCIIADVETNRYKSGIGLFLPLSSHKSEINQYYNARFLRHPGVDAYFNQGETIHFINVNLYPVESRVFLTDNKTTNSMPIYFNENCSQFVKAQVERAAKSLVSLMVLTGEYPLVRFYNPVDLSHPAKRLCELLADEFQTQIDEYARLNQDYPPASVADKPRSILLICDRTLDLFAPLLHEFSYQAMAMDIVPDLERTGVYKYQAESEAGDIKEVEAKLDDENDEDWINLRHVHIIEASELIIARINDLIKNNPLMVDRSKASSSSDLMYVVAHLKGFDEERKYLTLHKKLIDECLDINSSRKLAEFAADFEQTCCADGVTFEGERNKTLHDDLIVLLAREDLHINDKIRLVLMYAFYRGGLSESDFKKLAKFIGVNDREIIGLISRCFTNLYKLGFPIVKTNVKDKPMTRTTFHDINNEGTYNTSRFIPAIKQVLTKASRYHLDEEWFPYFRDKPLQDDIPVSSRANTARTNQLSNGTGSLRNPRIKASWASSSSIRHVGSTSSSIHNPLNQKIFCYVAGGITYSEIRSIYELSSSLNKEFYIGSESILKPRDFLIGLQSIDKAKSPIDLDLNIAKELNQPRECPQFLYETAAPPPPRTGSLPPNQAIQNQMNKFQHDVEIQQKIFEDQHSLASSGHYRKRLSASTKSSSGSNESKPKEKETKTSRLKKLFK